MKKAVLILQDRTHRAGAQTCLMRLLRYKTMREWNPIIVCGAPGWLTRECEKESIPVIYETFPKSRSLFGRIFGNAQFADRVVSKIRGASEANIKIVQANDHIEGILGLLLAERLDARSAIFLRSSNMTKRDYYKYGCERYDLVASVGEELRLRAQAWNPEKSIHLIPDGIESEEIIAPKPKPKRAPSKLLVIGSPSPLKGWADLIDALHFLEKENALQQMTFDFCGGSPDPSTQDLKLNRLRHRCNFLGRVEAFRDLVRDYDLVINPSRKESFGMAALEVMAAGVPLLSSRTGVIEQVQHNAEMLFSPHQPRALADALRNILTRWSDVDFGAAAAQDEIRRLFLVDKTADRLSDAYSRLLAKAA